MDEGMLIDAGEGIYVIDTGFQRKGLVACHLLKQGDRYAFIDVGTTSCLRVLRRVMKDLEIRPQQVDYIIVTHVHLDHAGAAGSLMQELPEARLVVHPRGARHMIDPSKLIAGAAAVYGLDNLHKTFGEILPVAADRVIEVGDAGSLDINGRELQFLDTPGHAKHHFCVYDERSRGFFSGDTFGLAYAPLAVDGRSFVFPTTTPVQFDPPALHASIDRMMAYRPQHMYMTHFGKISDCAQAAQQLHHFIDAHVHIAEQAAQEDADCEASIQAKLQDLLLSSLREFGSRLHEDQVLSLMRMDLRLNSQGLCCWLEYRKNEK